jgi:ribosomal-protein-alanine N-acetyltransferase
VIGQALEAHSRGTTLPHVVLDDSGSIAGRITLSGIVHRAFHSCSVGYWVGQSHNGRGVATEALRDIRRLAFGHLQLHRIEAATLLHNAASQKVLARNGFARIGLAPDYLKIAGRWQDHALFQVLNPAGG